MSPILLGCAYAAILTSRARLSVIYTGAALAKVLDEAWRHGDATFFISYDPDFGLAPPLQVTLGPLLHSFGFVAVLSWAVIVTGFAIGLGILGSRPFRLVALVATGGLHLAIVLGIELVSFGLTMIAFVLIACCPRPLPATPQPTARSKHARGSLHDECQRWRLRCGRRR